MDSLEPQVRTLGCTDPDSKNNVELGHTYALLRQALRPALTIPVDGTRRTAQLFPSMESLASYSNVSETSLKNDSSCENSVHCSHSSINSPSEEEGSKQSASIVCLQLVPFGSPSYSLVTFSVLYIVPFETSIEDASQSHVSPSSLHSSNRTMRAESSR